MSRAWCRAALVAAMPLVTTLALPGEARAQDAAGVDAPSGPRGRALSLKLAGGPGWRGLHGHRLLSGDLEAAVGGQSNRIGALHGVFAFSSGGTEEGLSVRTLGLGISWERPIGRFRPGLVARGWLLSFDRLTRDETMHSVALTGGAFATVDVIETEHVAMFLGLQGDIGIGGDDGAFGGGALRLGTRFLAF